MPDCRYRRLIPTLLLMLALLAGLLAGFRGVAFGGDADAGQEEGPLLTLGDLNGRRLGVIAGTILDTAADTYLDFTQFVYYDDSESEIEGLYAGEIDAILDDEPVARYLASVNPRLRVLPGTLDEDHYGFALRLEDEELYERVNAVLGELMTDGTLDALKARWLDAEDDALRVMPPLPDRTAGAFLRLGVSPVSAPFTYKKDGQLVGLDVELIQLLAERLDMRFQVVPMEFSELIPSLQDGRVDIIGSCLSITEERKKGTSGFRRDGAARKT